MATLAKLVVELGLDDKISAGLAKVQKDTQAWGRSMQKAGGILTAAVTVPLVMGFAKAISAASDLGEATSATQTVYGDLSDEVQSWAKTTTDAYGISNTEALTAVNTMGQLYKGVGLTTDQAATFGQAIVGAAGDLASFNNVPTDVALADLQSGLVGQYEPLRKYGIVLSEASVQQEALRQTGKASADQLTEGEKVAARQALIIGGLGDAAGDAARTHDSLANTQRRLHAQFKDISAQLGQQLLPLMVRLAKVASDLLKRFSKLSPRMQKFIGIGLLIAAALGPVLLILGTLLTMLPAIGAAFAVLTGPVGLVIAALVLLGVAYKTNFLGFADAVNAVVRVLWDFASAVIEAFRSGEPISELVKGLPGPLQRAAHGFLMIVDAIGDLYAAFQSGGLSGLLKQIPEELKQIAIGLFELWSSLAVALWDAFRSIDWPGVAAAVWTAAKAAWDAIDWGTIAETLRTWLANLGTWAAENVPDLLTTLWQKAVDLIQGIQDGINARWPEVRIWLMGVGIYAFTAVGDLIATLASRGRDLIQGLWQAASDRWTSVKGWLEGRAAAAYAAVGELGRTLWVSGLNLILGLLNAAQQQWGNAQAWLGGVAGLASSAVGDLSGALSSAGASLIQGLINGINSMVPSLSGVLAGITNMIPNLKGPPVKDAKLLVNSGRLVMQGFSRGLADGWQDVSGQLGGFTADIPTAFSSSTNGTTTNMGGITIQVSGAGDPDAVADRVFAKFSRELGLQAGL